MPIQKYLKVLPNPYGRLDEAGNPCAAFPCEPAHVGRGAIRYVGATFGQVPAPVAASSPTDGGGSPVAIVVRSPAYDGPREKRRFTFDEATPVEVPKTPYYIGGLVRGELFPADAATARAANVRWDGDGTAGRLLKASRDRAAAEYKREYDELPPWAQRSTPTDPPAEAPRA